MEKIHYINLAISEEIYRRKRNLHRDTTWRGIIIAGIIFKELSESCELSEEELLENFVNKRKVTHDRDN